jgi:hypothetical protein
MLRIAGYDARITWLGTNDLPYNLRYPTIAVLNHVICIVYLNKGKIVLDPTDKYANLGDIPSNIQGCRIMIENDNTFTLDSLPVLMPESNFKSCEYNYHLEDENLKGKLKINFKGDSRERIHYILENLATSDQKTILEKIMSQNLPNVIVNNVKYPVLHNHDSLFTIQADIVVKGKVSTFENELYISPESLEDFSALSVSEDRISDLDFYRRIFRKSIVNISLPEGYKIKQLPKFINISNDLSTFSINFYNEGKNIISIKEFKLLVNRIPRSRIIEWNNYLKQINKAYAQQIVLQTTK